MNEIRQFSSIKEMAVAAACEVEAIITNKKSTIAVAGGSTPKSLYNILREKLDWNNISVTLTDEREDKSNETMIRDNLLGDGAIFNSIDKKQIFDLVILGMGENGHIASLFPGNINMDNKNIYAETTSPLPPYSRISLTFSSLLNSKKIILYISGKNKLKTYNTALKLGSFEELPVRVILSQDKVPVITFWAP